MNQTTIPADATLAFEHMNDKWHMRIHRAADGTAIIERVRGPGRNKPAIWTTDHMPEAWVNMQYRPSEYTPVGTPRTQATISLAGDTWRILGIGRRDDEAGRIYLHLASTTRGTQQKNGFNPAQIADWIPIATLHAAYAAA